MSAHYLYTSVVVPSSVVIPLGMGAVRYRVLPRPHRILLFYLVFAGVVDAAASYMSRHHIHNLWLLHIYTAVETVLLLWFYRSILSSPWLRKAIPYAMVVFPLVCLVNILWWQSLLHFNTYTRPVEALLLIYLGLVYFMENSAAPSKSSLSWMNAGILLYFSVSFFIFIFSNFLHHGQLLNTIILVSHATFVLIMYLLFTVGFYTCRR
jgi:hypothetical protein